jgi:hypothetical protein
MLYMRALSDSVAWIARGQHGLVTRAQLLDVGFDRSRVARWVADGRLCRVHQGGYAVGRVAPSLRRDYLAAVLAAGVGAVLSHLPAAYLLRVVRGAAPPPEVTIPVTAGRCRPGITIHRSRLHPLDVSELDHIPITTVPRILLDLAPRLSPKSLARACHEASVRHDTTPDQIEACIARNPRRPGTVRLRHALGSDVTLSVLEDAFLELLMEHNLPLPRTNIDHRGYKVDCHWPELGLTVELWGYRYHRSREAFDTDLVRRRRSGHIAFGYGDVVDHPQRTAAEVRALIAQGPR